MESQPGGKNSVGGVQVLTQKKRGMLMKKKHELHHFYQARANHRDVGAYCDWLVKRERDSMRNFRIVTKTLAARIMCVDVSFCCTDCVVWDFVCFSKPNLGLEFPVEFL